MIRYGVFLLIWLLPGPALAASFADAVALFEDGEFEAAAEMGEQLGTAEALALAARSHLVRVSYLLEQKQAKDALERALEDSRRALDQAPGNVEAALQRTLALGYRSRVIGGFRAHLGGLARDSRQLIEMALEKEPENPWVHMVHGGWHAEILGKGRMGRMLYDVEEETAASAFEKALLLSRKQEGVNPTIWVEAARQLLRLSPTENAARASALLQEAQARGPRNALDELALVQGKHLLQALDTKSERAIDRMLKACDAFRAKKWTDLCR